VSEIIVNFRLEDLSHKKMAEVMNNPDKLEIELSLIVPVYNCSSWIAEKIQQFCVFLEQKEFLWELIIIDDGSKDNTPATIEQIIAGFENIHLLVLEKNLGKGGAVLTGLRSAKGKYLIFTDCDLAYPLSEVDKILTTLKKGADVAIANRRNENSICELKPRIFKQVYSRELSGRILNRFIRFMGLTEFQDTQAGLKGMHSWLVPHLNIIDVFSFGFDIELLLVAKYCNAHVEPVAVLYQYFEEESSVSLLKDGSRIFRDILKIKQREWRGIYRS
jgi:dolichyl-phosphate beta-glucosyltransferase